MMKDKCVWKSVSERASVTEWSEMLCSGRSVFSGGSLSPITCIFNPSEWE